MGRPTAMAAGVFIGAPLAVLSYEYAFPYLIRSLMNMPEMTLPITAAFSIGVPLIAATIPMLVLKPARRHPISYLATAAAIGGSVIAYQLLGPRP